MTKFNASYTDFSAGELSPKLYGRFDLQAFYSGHRRIENFIIESSGQASNRLGLYYAAGTQSNNLAMKVTFSYDDDISYSLEFTDQKIRFFTNNGIVESGGSPYTVTSPYLAADLFQLKFAQNGLDLYITHPSYAPRKLTYTSATSWALSTHNAIQETFENQQRITGITQASPAVVTYAGSDTYANGDIIKITGVSGMTEVNDRRFKVANVNTGTNTFELVDEDTLANINATGYNAYSSGGIIREITQNVASFIASNEYPSAVGFYEDRLVYGGSNNKPNTLYFSKSADADDFTLGTEVDDGIEYVVTGVEGKIAWLAGTEKFLGIGTFGDVFLASGGADGVITPTSISIKPTNSYGVSDINPISRGTQIFFVQRGGLILRSLEFKFETDSYVPVDRNILADHITKSGIKQISFQEGRPNILWAVRNDGVLCGMTLEESESISGWHRHTTDGEIVSVSSLPRENANNQLWVCVKRTINGSDKYYIEYMNDPVVFPQREDYVTDDETTDFMRYRNLTFEKQKEYIYVDSALSYYGYSAGVDAGATMTPSATTGTGVTFTASASVFVSGDVGREIWKKSTTGDETGRAVITAYTSGTQVTCDVLEDFDSTTAMAAGDWYLTASTFSDLDHLEGETVTIIADGGQHSQKTVSSGSITLDRQASVIHVGLGYKSYIETNSLEGGGTSGASQTKKKSIYSVGVRFFKTMFGKVGAGYYKLEQIYERTSSMNMDRPPLPYTGDKKIDIINKPSDDYSGGWQRDTRVIVSQDQPFPMSVQLIIPYADVSNV